MSNPVLNLLPSVLFILAVSAAFAYLVHRLTKVYVPKEKPSVKVHPDVIHQLMKSAHRQANVVRFQERRTR